MTSKTKKILSIFALMLFFTSAVFAAPSPGGKGRIGSYNSPMQHSRTTSNVNFPYPSNRWFGSIFTSHNYHTYSFRMSASPWLVNLNTAPGGAAAGNGYLLGYPSLTYETDIVSNNYNPQYIARVSGMKQPSNQQISAAGGLLDSYSDWAATFICADSLDSSKWIKTTIGKGFVFTYNEYSENLNPRISSYNSSTNFVYDLSGNALSGTVQSDCVLVKTSPDATGRVVYYAVYTPANTTFNIAGSNIDITFSSSERYLSTALITAGPDDASTKSNAVTIFNDYRQYAYNFITDTKISYVFDRQNAKVTTTFSFTTVAKRSGAGFVSGTVFALFPHQWKNSSAVLKPASYNFKTLRGVLKVGTGSSFTTENKFFGILPNLTYEVPQSSRNTMQGYINNDRNFTATSAASDTYYSGKALAKAANLIPVFHQFGDISGRNQMIERLKAQLKLWYTYGGQSQKYFAYDSNWGGMIGMPYAFGSENYADHHFHYGYYVYASAILSLFDPQFADSSEYKGVVDLIVKDIYNPVRGDADFPFLRNFDVYEGHSWASGFGGTDDRGIDQESSAEAMNAWTGVYLWGLASNNQALVDLGAYGYTTEYEATKEYYFDTSGTIYTAPYAHKGIGILWDNQSIYSLHFTPVISQTIKGIQILPLTPAMLYLGHDVAYAQSYYNEMYADRGAPVNLWKDIWLRYKSLFDAAGALSDFVAGGFTAEEGSSLTFSYQFINFFNAYGTVDTSISADKESFCIMNKGGQKSYIAFNSSTDSYKTVEFKAVSGGAVAGNVKVPPMTTVVTKDFANFKYDSLRTMYSSENNYVLLMDLYSDGVTAVAASTPAINETYYKTIPFAFTVNSQSGVLNNVKSYIQLSGVNIPLGFTASQIRVTIYNSETGQPDKILPAQSITVESESGGVATVLIESVFTRTGTYVLVIPTGVNPPGSSIVSGTLLSAQPPMPGVSATMQIYSSVSNSTTTEIFSGSYQIEALQGANYVLTPTAGNYSFEPVNFSFTASSSNITQNFAALPKYMLSGIVSFNLRGMDKIKVNVYDMAAGSTKAVTTAGDGRYIGDIYYGKNYIVTPVSAEYDFTPASVLLTSVSASVLSADFHAKIAAGKFIAYPNPYKPSKHGDIGITFTGLVQGAEIKIYNIAGELVFEAKSAADVYVWDGSNNSGNQAASGVYIYLIKSGSKTLKGKIAIER